jgi:hypothetical protein
MKRIYADSHPPLLNPRDIDFLLYEWLGVEPPPNGQGRSRCHLATHARMTA